MLKQFLDSPVSIYLVYLAHKGMFFVWHVL